MSGSLITSDLLMIYTYDAEQGCLVEAFGVNHGRPRAGPPLVIPLDHPQSLVARTARERKEFLYDRMRGDLHAMPLPDIAPPSTGLFGPLVVGNKLLGVLTIQSRTSLAYDERERLIFRTLSAFGAIALDNALQARELRDARARGRGGQPRQERVPGQHEPRDPHADERDHRHVAPGAAERR